MVNVNCAGRQDKATTTSETPPYIPPSKTRNCYTNNDGPAPFDNSLCGTANDKACTGKGGINACKPDNYGGYCKVGNQYYISQDDRFIELTSSLMLDRYKEGGNINETNRIVNRALNNQERRFTNRIRELQIMGRDPIPKRKKDTEKESRWSRLGLRDRMAKKEMNDKSVGIDSASKESRFNFTKGWTIDPNTGVRKVGHGRLMEDDRVEVPSHYKPRNTQ